MLYQKNLPVKYEPDVFIAGGGPAGVCAAIAAARMGRSVFLAEAQGSFGGLGTAGLVPAFAVFGDDVHILAAGIGLEIRQRVCPEQPLSKHWAGIRVERLKRAYDDLIEASGVRYSFFTTLCDVVAENGVVDHVVLTSKSGMFAVRAKVYIDCTGDGDLCAYAGSDFEKGDENGAVMPPTLCSLWSNIAYARRSGPDSSRLEEAIRDGVFSQPDRHLPGFFTVNREKGIGGGNIGHVFDVDPLDEVSLSAAMVDARRRMDEYEHYYKQYLKGYEDMELVTTASILGVRESRRICCDYMLNSNDFLSRAVFDDEIGRYCYPVDIHIMNTDPEELSRFETEYRKTYRYAKGESYGIPYRSLIPRAFSNVLVAGRCMGTDRRMQASVRVMPGCFITGQAAGVAAALAVVKQGNVRAIDIHALQSALIGQGAYLPNAKAST